MPWFYLMINGAALCGAIFLGWRSRHLNAWRFAACLAAAAAVLALRIFLHAHPEYEQFLLGLSDDYVYFAAWEAPVVALMATGLAMRLESSQPRRLAFLALVLLAPLFLWDSLFVCIQPDYAMAAQIDGDGVCRQAMDYSCGPAAGVTLLRLLGVELSEGEMAKLCLLRPGKGVTVLELCRGVNIALRPTGRRAAVRKVAPEQIDSMPTPFLAEVGRPGSPDHCVVVLAVLADCVIVADPARGQSVIGKEQFIKEWTGIAITAEPFSR